MRASWFVPVHHRDYDRMPASVWIRSLQLIPYLEERGVLCRLNEPDADADIAIFVRWQDGHAYELAQRQKHRGQRIVFDLCANYFDETGLFEGGYGTTRERVTEALRMVGMADVVVCASSYIAQRAREFHSWVEYLPDSIDRRHFSHTKLVEDLHRRKLRAIWSGVASKARELEPILPLLKRRGIELTVISDHPPRLMISAWPWKRRYKYCFVPWRYDTFPRCALEGEICVVHRPVDDPYNRGHSLFKIGVFMAQGVPTIASPVPSYEEVLGGGRGGALCYSMGEWEEILDRVLYNRDVLVEWSQQAPLAMEPYWTERVAGDYARLFEQVCW